MDGDAIIAVGNFDQSTKVIMIGFKQQEYVGRAYGIIQSLQALGSIDAGVEPFLGLYHRGSVNGFHILMVYMPPTLDAYDIGEIITTKVEEQLSIKLEGYDLTLTQQFQYAEVYHFRKGRKGE